MSTIDVRTRAAEDEPAAPPPRAGRNDHVTAQSPTLVLLVLVATIGILAYAAFLLNPANRGDLVPYVMVLTAEAILIFQALLSMWTILSGGHDARDFAYFSARERLLSSPEDLGPRAQRRRSRWPLMLEGREITVDVFITTYGEDVAVIRETVRAAVAMAGRHVTWVLDDGRSDEVRDLAAEHGARYVRRLSGNGAKAGNINHALALTNGELFVVLDADFVPSENFLVETVPFFVNPDVAFVQTPQTYGNLHNLISKGAGYMQSVFYRFIQPGRNRFNAAFCVGTNVVFRRAAVDEVGGMFTDSKSEDVWTSLLLHEKGWKSVFLPMTLAVGEAPDTVEAYTKQQLRWATGGFEILLSHNPLSRKRRLTVDQRLQYLVTATHYLTGICPLILLLVPPLEIYLDLRPMDLTITWYTWILYYAGFYVLQIALAFYTLGSFRWQTLMLATVSFPIYVRALINVISGREQKWSATGDRSRVSSPFNFMIPQVLFFAFLLLTSGVAVWRDLDNGVPSLAMAWNVTNTMILGFFVLGAAREARQLRPSASRSARRARSGGTRMIRRPVGVLARVAEEQRGAA
ncbi:glycosyltransferase family 2 protein [Naasia sp. SYSU D00948]|uniref:glycosyltransferase family 2 protein n=1 Tax=Naasia sp. SYSU D00948 TaxID=2817379 RepID=UPI001B30A461|nr:cellulose synthase catalytic subunit [Naasia sp. SYSU D00948]